MDPVVGKIAEQFQVVHGNLRDEVRGLSVEQLNWKPAPETNSIAVLVVHTLGSEAEVLRVAQQHRYAARRIDDRIDLARGLDRNHGSNSLPSSCCTASID